MDFGVLLVSPYYYCQIVFNATANLVHLTEIKTVRDIGNLAMQSTKSLQV